jgi:hypothetical protein
MTFNRLHAVISQPMVNIKWAVFRLLMLVSRLEFSSALKMKAEAYVPLKRPAFSELHGVTTHKTVLSVKNKLFLCLITHKAMMTYGDTVVQLHVFFISALDVDEWSASSTGRFIPGGYPLDMKLDGPPDMDTEAKGKIFVSTGN